MTVLTYEEFKKSCGFGDLKGSQFESADEMRRSYREIFNLDLDEEIDKLTRDEYNLYLRRVQAGVE